MSAWDNPDFAKSWNDTYGLDMIKAPMRAGMIYPILAARIWPKDNPEKENLRLVDFGCGNGNLIHAFRERTFAEWLGIDNGTAILETAGYLKEDSRVTFLNRDIGQNISEIDMDQDFDHAVSVFTLEEIPIANMDTLFKNMAAAVCKRQGSVHIFTQHPAYAMRQDWVANSSGQENSKFKGHNGYFDTEGTTYSLATMNAQNGFLEMANYYHKPLGNIITGLAKAKLCVREMIEIPTGVVNLQDLAHRPPKSGDVPRFLYIEAGCRPAR